MIPVSLAQLEHDQRIAEAQSQELHARALRLQVAIYLHPDFHHARSVELAETYAGYAEKTERRAMEYRRDAASFLEQASGT